MSENYQIVTDKELHDDERISAYLRDRMPEEEEVTFLEELNSYSELRSKAISTAHLAKAMKKIGEENDEKVKEALLSINLASARHIASKTTWAIMPEACDYAITPKDMEESSTSSTTSETSDKRRRILKVISIAACFLVLFGVGFKYYEYRHVAKLGEEYGSVFVGEQAFTWHGRCRCGEGPPSPLCECARGQRLRQDHQAAVGALGAVGHEDL